MKITQVFFVFLLVVSCRSGKDLTTHNHTVLQDINCPEGGDCTFEVLKNSSLQIKTDAFSKTYPVITSGNQLVIKYEFKKKTDKDVADNSYSEFVYFEIDPNQKQLFLKDKELQKVKMLFGRICFCRDASGYFKISEGNLFLFNDNRNLQINATFHVMKVPQIVTEINEKINY